MRIPSPYLLLLFFSFLCLKLPAQTMVEKQGSKWTFMVEGKPFDVKGVTFGYDQDTLHYDQYFQELKFLGVNTIRTWGTTKHTGKLLEAAHAHGIYVMLGIWMRHGRPGMEADDSFDYLNDTEGKEAMYDHALDVVNTYKDHPAILTWGIGNEVYLNTETDEEKRVYSQLLERICAQIKTIDPHHPITSVEAWTFGVEWWNQYVPSLDIYGINTYGAGASVIPQELAKTGVDKPYVITEFGVRGEWEITEDVNGVKPEPSDEEKYEVIVKGYEEWIQPKPNCLGVYVFHYASDDRHMAPWLLTHFEGKTRPQYWAIREAFTGKKPDNHVPVIESFGLPDAQTKSGRWVPVTLIASDQEKEALDVHFYYNQRSGSRKRRDQMIQLNTRGSSDEGFEIQLPTVHGGIKVYAGIEDASGNIGFATTSIYVLDPKEAKRKFLVPSVKLPFYVYQDEADMPYVASAYMGNYKDMTVDLHHTETVKAGKTAIKIHYGAKDNWYGLGFVDPANDWGDMLGGYDIRGAKTLSFWAKASYDRLNVTVGFGLIEEDKPFPDTAIELVKLSLTNEWKQYTIPTKRLDLSCIRSGFVIFSAGEGLSHDIFLDEIVFE
ncbi:MAG: glycoside hydrolase family 2 TIM barrel-domain containing protein [Bacteroidota bacterium]